jgi:acyl-CoA synthetase (AMP-forming)/AMP-acid ligase II
VSAAAVFGVPDERLGERVVAVVETDAGAPLDEEAVRTHCLANLARYKVPERFVAVPLLPRNAMGTIVRAELPGYVSGGP